MDAQNSDQWKYCRVSNFKLYFNFSDCIEEEKKTSAFIYRESSAFATHYCINLCVLLPPYNVDSVFVVLYRYYGLTICGLN